MNILYFQDSRILRQGNRFFNAKDSHFFDRFTACLEPNEKLDIYMRQKELPIDYDLSKLMEVSTDKIRFHELPTFWNPFNWPSIRRTIKKALMTSDFSFLRAEGIFGCVAGLYALKYKKVYMSIMPADPKVGLRKHGLLGWLFSLIHVPNVKKVVKNADYAYYVTDSYLQKRYPSNGVILGCSDVQLVSVSEELLRKRLDRIKEKKKLIVGSAGALLPSIKGQDFVLKAISLLPNVDIEYRLIGLGSHDELLKIAEKYKVSAKLKIDGTIPHDQVFQWLDHLDLYIQPSRTEGLPRALIEAMSRALPCIGTNVGGIPELLSNECIFCPNSKGVRSLAKLLCLFTNPDVQKRYATINFHKAKTFDKNLIDLRQREYFKEFNDYARSCSSNR